MAVVKQQFKRLPRHVGIIPDGNRRWAAGRGLNKEYGYQYGLVPGVQLFEICQRLGIEELTFYGFTQDNMKRPAEQTQAFRKACVDAVRLLSQRDAALLVVGDDSSPAFPEELKPYRKRRVFGNGGIKVNFLVNYGWNWDLSYLQQAEGVGRQALYKAIASRDVSRIDLIVRWGDRRRLSGFLPVQSVYADFYVVDALWPDFVPEHFYQALRWYEQQDVTLGG